MHTPDGTARHGSWIGGVGPIELVVPDTDPAVSLLTDRYGFIKGPDVPAAYPGETARLLLQGGIRFHVTAPTDSTAAAASFLAEHGEGVRGIGLRVPDAEAAWCEAVQRGAAPTTTRSDGRPAISVFGAFEHVFLTEEAEPSEGTAGTAPQPDRVDHLALAVPFGELDAWTVFYAEVLLFEMLMKETTDTGRSSMRSTVVREPRSGVTITLVEPGTAEGDDQINMFLNHNGGPGVQHVALRTADILGTVDGWTAAGVRFLSAPDSYYTMLPERVPAVAGEVAALRPRAVLMDVDEGGALLQIFTKPVFSRPTLFFELIERRGRASGFGAGNIKALFEAVENEQRKEAGR